METTRVDGVKAPQHFKTPRSHDVLVDLDLDVGTDRQPQFLVALHLLDNTLAPDPSLEGRPVPLSQVESSTQIRVDALLVALGTTLFELFPRFASRSDLRRF